MTLVHRLREIGWRLSTKPIQGVRAVVLTPEGRVVLLRQRYTQGWHLPGGGRALREAPEAAMARELREEIGFLSGTFELHDTGQGMLGRRPWTVSTFVVRDACFRPRWNLEIEAVETFDPDALPGDLAGATAAVLRTCNG